MNEFDTAGGCQKLQCWNTEGIFRLIQSIPSPKAETVADRDAFDHGVFAANGGFLRLNKTFEGQLESVVSDFHERIWQDAAA